VHLLQFPAVARRDRECTTLRQAHHTAGKYTVSPKTFPTFSTVIIRFWSLWYEYSWHNLRLNDHLVFLPYPTFVSALPGENITSEILLFYLMWYDCLINITRKTQFVHISNSLANNLFSCPFFQLPAVKLLEVLAHYANTGKETLSLFIDSSIDNVLLQINLGCTSCLLTLQTFLNFIWQAHCCMSMTVKTYNRPAVGAHRLG